MANQEHLAILKQGVNQWNTWRKENPGIKPELSWADLSKDRLSGVDFSGANMEGANLSRADVREGNLRNAYLFRSFLSNANLEKADLSEAFLLEANIGRANLSGANLAGAMLANTTLVSADLNKANLQGAVLSGANLTSAKLHEAELCSAKCLGCFFYASDLRGADLRSANLNGASLVQANLEGADLTGANIYGIAAWDVNLENTAQHNLIISRGDEPVITVDNLEIGQFIYLILNNTKIRDVINSITSKGVLILGRFSDPQRKSVLDGLREKLREYNLLPIVFDFDRPTDRDYTETVQTLAGMSMFVIVDVTNPKSTPMELEATVSRCKIPYIPIIDVSVDPRPFAMLVDSQKSFHWVLPTIGYKSKKQLLSGDSLKKHIIAPAVAKREELRKAKNQEPEMIMLD